MPTLEDLAGLQDALAVGSAGRPLPSAGRTRRALRRLLLRLIRPHTAHQQAVNREIVRILSELIQTSHILSARIDELTTRVADGAREAGKPVAQVDRELAAVDETAEMVAVVESRLRGALSRLSALEESIEAVRARISPYQDAMQAAQRIVRDARGLPFMWNIPLERFHDEAAGSVYGFRSAVKDTAPHELYRNLLDIFRGPPQWVKDRQRSYLKVIGGRSPVIDLGCGRGEFLDALRERGLAYTGVDADPAMIEACRALGHEVVAADASTFLAAATDNSLGAIFSAQLVEHLATDDLVGLLRLSVAKLKPAGIFIAETPNMHSIHSSKMFWLDLTHEHPIFPEVALSLSWLTGFASAYIYFPAGSGDHDADRFAEPEYAIVAVKSDSVEPDTVERSQATSVGATPRPTDQA